jgi:hypothetical protein
MSGSRGRCGGWVGGDVVAWLTRSRVRRVGIVGGVKGGGVDVVDGDEEA